MPTLTEVAEKRKEFNGRALYEKFAAYCKERDLQPVEQVLATWDEKFNNGEIRKHFGDREDIYRVGLLELYRRFLNHNCLRISTGTVTLPSGKTYTGTVIEPRRYKDDDGATRVAHLREVTTVQLNIIREQFRAELRQLLHTQKFFNLPAGEIRTMTLAFLDEEGL